MLISYKKIGKLVLKKRARKLLMEEKKRGQLRQ